MPRPESDVSGAPSGVPSRGGMTCCRRRRRRRRGAVKECDEEAPTSHAGPAHGDASTGPTGARCAWVCQGRRPEQAECTAASAARAEHGAAARESSGNDARALVSEPVGLATDTPSPPRPLRPTRKRPAMLESSATLPAPNGAEPARRSRRPSHHVIPGRRRTGILHAATAAAPGALPHEFRAERRGRARDPRAGAGASSSRTSACRACPSGTARTHP